MKMKTFNEFGQPVGEALIDWQPRPIRPGWCFRAFCRLEPLRVEHADALFSAYSLAEDTRSWTWLLREPDATAAEYAEWVASVSELSDPSTLPLLITRPSLRWDAGPDADRS
jgi:hypothetical protein